jgi:hypothetical protein
VIRARRKQKEIMREDRRRAEEKERRYGKYELCQQYTGMGNWAHLVFCISASSERAECFVSCSEHVNLARSLDRSHSLLSYTHELNIINSKTSDSTYQAFPFCCIFTNRYLVSASNNGDPLLGNVGMDRNRGRELPVSCPPPHTRNVQYRPLRSKGLSLCIRGDGYHDRDAVTGSSLSIRHEVTFCLKVATA